ncbi:MAG: 3-phosphoserine/phosphohydroxythreonine transaminase [Propionibacteriaceae bacterium]
MDVAHGSAREALGTPSNSGDGFHMTRIYNFSAGPSVLPVPVLEACARDMLDYKGSGMSVMEMSHRSKVYLDIFTEAEALLRQVLEVPDNYKVLFLQGGATLQFAMVPMNLMKEKADYVVTGSFAKSAYNEGKKYGQANLAATSEPEKFSFIPRQGDLKLDPEASFVHICENNTIEGTKWDYIPETGNVPLISDMSSCILSEKIDWSKYAMIYMGAQKNMAPAGLTVVIMRDDMDIQHPAFQPIMMDYQKMIDKESMYNTPSCWPIYVLGENLKWVQEQGGVEAMHELAVKRSSLIYDFLETSTLFKATADKQSRSMMNVTFTTGDDELDALFAKESAAAGMSNLKGHRSVGGMRASIYNAMPVEGVETLVAFMKAFEAKHGK